MGKSDIAKISIVYLQANLSHERFQHSVQVGDEMESIAPYYGLDPWQAKIAGLLHDVANEIPKPVMEELVRENDPDWWKQLPETCRHEVYLHDPAGAILAKRLIPQLDPAVVSAIRNHVLNDPDMPLLTRCLRVADMCHPVKEYPAREQVQKLLRAGDVDLANLVLDLMGLAHFKSQGLPILPALIANHPKLELRVGKQAYDRIKLAFQ